MTANQFNVSSAWALFWSSNDGSLAPANATEKRTWIDAQENLVAYHIFHFNMLIGCDEKNVKNKTSNQSEICKQNPIQWTDWPLCGYYTGFGSRKKFNFDVRGKQKMEKRPGRFTLSCFPKFGVLSFHFSQQKTNALTILQRFASNPDQSGTCVFLSLSVCVTMGILKNFFQPNNSRWIPSDNTFYYTFLNIDSAMINTLTRKERTFDLSLSLSLVF